MRLTSRSQSVSVDEENPYWMSFSDLMSGLLVIFILASVVLIIQLTEAQVKFEQEMTEKRKELRQQQEATKALQLEMTRQKKEVLALKEELRLAKLKIQDDIEQLRHAEQVRHDILYEIKAKLAIKNIKVEVVDNDTVLRIPESTLTFLSNSYKIPKDIALRKAIENIGLVLHQAILEPFNTSKNNQKRFEYLDTVFIEGHTDSRPTSRIKGNWGLSTFRAISLWEFWENSLKIQPHFREMENASGKKLFSVSGYAASRRLQLIEESSEERRANRRIDLRFTVKRPSIKQFEDIIKK